MAGRNRIEELAAFAESLKRLPVADQFLELGKRGLKLDDVNWKNRVSDSSPLISRIPTSLDGKQAPQKG